MAKTGNPKNPNELECDLIAKKEFVKTAVRSAMAERKRRERKEETIEIHSDPIDTTARIGAGLIDGFCDGIAKILRGMGL
jgi:hypothetical protein